MDKSAAVFGSDRYGHFVLVSHGTLTRFKHGREPRTVPFSSKDDGVISWNDGPTFGTTREAQEAARAWLDVPPPEDPPQTARPRAHSATRRIPVRDMKW